MINVKSGTYNQFWNLREVLMDLMDT